MLLCLPTQSRDVLTTVTIFTTLVDIYSLNSVIHMSKNQDRYKEDYIHIDMDELDELEVEKFQKLRPKKTASKTKNKSSEQEQD